MSEEPGFVNCPRCGGFALLRCSTQRYECICGFKQTKEAENNVSRSR